MQKRVVRRHGIGEQLFLRDVVAIAVLHHPAAKALLGIVQLRGIQNQHVGQPVPQVLHHGMFKAAGAIRRADGGKAPGHGRGRAPVGAVRAVEPVQRAQRTGKGLRVVIAVDIAALRMVGARAGQVFVPAEIVAAGGLIFANGRAPHIGLVVIVAADFSTVLL